MMLNLKPKPTEEIVIEDSRDNEWVLTIHSYMRDGEFYFAFDAPRHISITRKESDGWPQKKK